MFQASSYSPCCPLLIELIKSGLCFDEFSHWPQAESFAFAQSSMLQLADVGNKQSLTFDHQRLRGHGEV